MGTKVTVALSSINPNNTFDFVFFSSSTQNSLSILFLQYKISLCRRNTYDLLVAVLRWIKLWDHLSRKVGEKILESGRAASCKIATCMRQTSLLAKQAETKRLFENRFW